jgi:hypothetical protein
LKKVEAESTDSNTSFSAGSIVGIQVSVIVGGFLMGVMSAFVYLKLTKKTTELFPVMQYVNPNFNKDDSK